MNSSTELDYARELTGSAMVAPDHYLDIITVACGLTYKIDDVFTAPRILALGAKGSGKSTALKVANYLAANTTGPTGVLAMTAPSYVAEYRMNARWTPCIDEINHLFGEAGNTGKNSKFYTYVNQGYSRETAFAQHQENKVSLRIPIFGVVFLAGLGLACPPDMRDRAIVLKMEKAPDNAVVADFSMPETRTAFAYAGKMLKSWAERQPKLDISQVRGLHPKLNHRTMEIWGPLFALVHGDEVWTKRMLTAFERIELDAGIPVYAPEDQILADWLKFSDLYDVSDGIPSGQFAEFANSQGHGAYLHMKPGQFRQFAVAVLGPTTPFYDQAEGTMRRGWSDVVQRMNTDNARMRTAELEARNEETPAENSYEDF